MSFTLQLYRAPGGEPLLLEETQRYFDRQPYCQQVESPDLPDGSAAFLYESEISGVRFTFLFDGGEEERCAAAWDDHPGDEPVALPTPLTLTLDVNRPPDWAQEAFPIVAEAGLALHLWAERANGQTAEPVDVDALIERWNAANAAAGWGQKKRPGCAGALLGLGPWLSGS